MIVHGQAFGTNGKDNPLLGPLSISFGVHIVLFLLVIYTPQWESKHHYMPSVIDVRMVDLAPVSTFKDASPTEIAPVVERPKKAETKSEAIQMPDAAKPEVSVAPRRKKTKTALKYKTFKTEAMKKKALKQLLQKVRTSTPKPLQDRLKELREKVAKEGKPTQSGAVAKEGTQATTGGGYTTGSKQEVELINLYRLEIAYAVNKNWAFADQLSGRKNKLMASIAFKVLPDGKIVDIFFTDRSGNSHLDDSAHKAIVKSSPVKPHPPALKQAYVEMGLRFTPEGVR